MCEVKISRSVREHSCLDCFHKAHDPGQCSSCNCGESESVLSISREEQKQARYHTIRADDLRLSSHYAYRGARKIRKRGAE
jgi:hypothetical protein